MTQSTSPLHTSSLTPPTVGPFYGAHCPWLRSWLQRGAVPAPTSPRHFLAQAADLAGKRIGARPVTISALEARASHWQTRQIGPLSTSPSTSQKDLAACGPFCSA
jgi:hypothetical protein